VSSSTTPGVVSIIHQNDVYALQHQQKWDIPNEEMSSNSASHSLFNQALQQQQAQQLRKQLLPWQNLEHQIQNPPMHPQASMLRGMKGTKICNEFRNRAARHVRSPSPKRALDNDSERTQGASEAAFSIRGASQALENETARWKS
jgi:hypothetical protein